MPTVLDDIEVGILQRLQSQGLPVATFDVSDLDDDDRVKLLKFPCVNVAVVGITNVRPNTMGGESWSLTPQVAVSVAVRNVKSEEAQRRALYPLIMGILTMLGGRTLTVSDPAPRTVDTGPVQLGAVRMVYENQAVQVWRLEMTAQTDLVIADDDQGEELLRIAMSLYLQEPADDDVADCEAVVELEE